MLIPNDEVIWSLRSKLKNEMLWVYIIQMLAGGRCYVDPTGFQNDMSVINSKDDV